MAVREDVRFHGDFLAHRPLDGEAPGVYLRGQALYGHAPAALDSRRWRGGGVVGRNGRPSLDRCSSHEQIVLMPSPSWGRSGGVSRAIIWWNAPAAEVDRSVYGPRAGPFPG